MPTPIRVAIVEDHADLRRSLAAVVAGTPGLTCVGDFGSARAYLKVEASLGAEVLLLDLELPGTNGRECLRELQARRRRIEVLILTIHDDAEWIFPALQAGASGYLVKPIEPAALVSAIREVHGGGAPMSAPIARRVLSEFRRDLSERAEIRTLTPREREVLEALARGLHYQEIAERLGVSRLTVASHLHRIYGKLHVGSATAAVARFLDGRSEGPTPADLPPPSK